MRPTAYILERRLNLARKDLLRANLSNHSVSTVARRNGFSHLGRFSVTYRAAAAGCQETQGIGELTQNRAVWVSALAIVACPLALPLPVFALRFAKVL